MKIQILGGPEDGKAFDLPEPLHPTLSTTEKTLCDGTPTMVVTHYRLYYITRTGKPYYLHPTLGVL